LERRRELGLTQKELASKIRRDDNQGAISPQYLNDIEHDRRNPTAHHLIEQLARVLQLDAPYLAYLAGQFPKESIRRPVDSERFAQAWTAFRKTIERRDGGESK
jgi:transcriptional regulator with XRE-family HTH domain